MTHGEIESFLAVCRHKTITRAAESLFISQSSLSIRLKTLERELGGALFLRRRGCREMNLTAAGKEFFELAQEYESLMYRMERVCRQRPRFLRISALNSLGTYLLPEVYESFLRLYPEVELQIQDMELDAACRSIHEGHTDIAFTSGKKEDSLLICRPAFSEPMTLISAMSLQEPVTREALSVRDEVYVEWNTGFARWHQRTFGLDTQPQISISIMEQLRRFMSRKDCWAIVPVSVADGLEQTCRLRRFATDFPLPDREISCVFAAESPNTATMELFLDCLKQMLAHQPQIRSFL